MFFLNAMTSVNFDSINVSALIVTLGAVFALGRVRRRWASVAAISIMALAVYLFVVYDWA